jgi:holo-[acyl-carrier protein] synthase
VIVGIGIDVVEIARIQRILDGPPARAERFLARCFTPDERAYCERCRDRAARFSARFAAKEAVSKALAAPAGIRFLDAEVRSAGGPPSLALSGIAGEASRRLRVARIHVTLTHDAGVAAAVVVLEAA